MLTVQKVTGGSASPYATYLISRTQGGDGRGDYYLNNHGRQEAPGRWALGPVGRQLLAVDADQPISEQDLRNLLNVRYPNDPQRPLRRNGSTGTATTAIDLTFSAPKSVSVVWALGSEDARRAIEEAHEQAVDRALEHALTHVPMVRRRIDRSTVVRERPAELIASVYRHTTARAVDGQVPDPQLHSHVLLHGALRAEDQGSSQPEAAVVAIESRAVMVHQREVGAAYRAALADRLRDLGFAIDRNTGREGRYFEIRGVPRSVIDRFSSRHRQVRERIEWRKAERLQGLRRLAKLDGRCGEEARIRLVGVEADLRAMRSEMNSAGDALHVAARVSDAEYQLLERRDGLLDLSRRVDAVGDVARARMEEVERWGDRLTPAQERSAAVESRAPKGLETHGDLDCEWGGAAAALGFDARHAQALSERGPEESPDRAELKRNTATNLTARRATFARREARAIALETASSEREAEGVLRDLYDTGEILRLEESRWTTTGQRELERRVLADAAQLARGRTRAVSPDLVSAEVEQLGMQFADAGGLAAEQEAAIRAATSDRQLVAIQGQAGTGKSTTLVAAARAEALKDRQVIVTSTGGQAAERLARDLRAAGVPAEALSTRALEAACDTGSVRLGPDTTVIHDECALAATDEQRFLFAACLDGGARLVEVGDPEQSTPVGAGGLMKHVERLAAEAGGFVALERIVRARDEADRAMQRALRAADTRAVVDSLESRERLVLARTRAEAAQHAVELWAAHRHHPDGALVICEGSNDQVDDLNAQLQAIRHDHGELGETAIDVPGRPYALHEGDEVVIRAQFHDTEHGTIRNGERATIARTDDDRVVLNLTGERDLALTTDGLKQADVRLAYAQHAHPAQGATTGVAIDVFSALSTRRGQYVALTRGRDEHRLVTSYEDLQVDHGESRGAALAALADQLRRDDPEVPSVDYAELPSRQRRRANALRAVADLAGNALAEQIRDAPPAPDLEALGTLPLPELVARSVELRSSLRAAANRAAREKAHQDRERHLRKRLDEAQARLDATRLAAPQRRRLRARAGDPDEVQLARQQATVEDIAARLADLAGPSSDPLEPPATASQIALEYVTVETALGGRLYEPYEIGPLGVSRDPATDIIERLGHPPADPVARELWERAAQQLERNRGRNDELPPRPSGEPHTTPTPGVSCPEISVGSHPQQARRATDHGLDLDL